jgi:hypothetical protein
LGQNPDDSGRITGDAEVIPMNPAATLLLDDNSGVGGDKGVFDTYGAFTAEAILDECFALDATVGASSRTFP